MADRMNVLMAWVAWLLILAGISAAWEFAEIALYGESQKSVVDMLAAIFMSERIFWKIRRG